MNKYVAEGELTGQIIFPFIYFAHTDLILLLVANHL